MAAMQSSLPSLQSRPLSASSPSPADLDPLVRHPAGLELGGGDGGQLHVHQQDPLVGPAGGGGLSGGRLAGKRLSGGL